MFGQQYKPIISVEAYIDYVAKNGGENTLELARNIQRSSSAKLRKCNRQDLWLL